VDMRSTFPAYVRVDATPSTRGMHIKSGIAYTVPELDTATVDAPTDKQQHKEFMAS